MSENTELQFYKKPFRQAKYGSWVYDNDSNFVFQFISRFDDEGNYAEGEKELQQNVIDSLNADTPTTISGTKFSVSERFPGYILRDGQSFILIRGWGGLTGVGGHNLPGEKAAEIQDLFRDWIIKKLSNQ